MKDGGMAFPGGSATEISGGMTLRDYFAAHAPADPQRWFRAIMPTKRPQAIRCDETREAINAEEIADWDEEREKQRHVQWPYAWADAMIAERERGREVAP